MALVLRWLARLTLLALLAPGPAWSQDGPLRIAMSGAFQPFSTIDAQGDLSGFDADIARALARAMGREPVLVQVDWAGIQAGLQSAKYDLICGSTAITEERAQSMSFSLPYYLSGAQVFGRGGVVPKRIGVTEASTYAAYLKAHPQRFQGIKVVAYGSKAEILAAIAANKVDGFISDRIVGGFYLARSDSSDIVPVGKLLYQEACGIAARGDLVRQVNAALLTLIGPSGSGKSTLLRCLNLLETPDSGELFWQNQSVAYQTASEGELSRYRTRVGMVFQHFGLFPHLSVLENVMEGPLGCGGASGVRSAGADPRRTLQRACPRLLASARLSPPFDGVSCDLVRECSAAG